MSANAHPTYSPLRPQHTQPDPVVDQLMALARNASNNVDEHDPIDYWYRLGQRNAYAHATAQILARELTDDPFVIAERITTALDAGSTEVHELRDAAYGHGTTTTPPKPAIEWVGPKAFDTQHRSIRGIDRDYGMRWGQRSNQRISLRLDGEEATRGLLYAYDPTWQEYAVLSTTAPRAAVDRAFAHATDTDIHMPIETFAQLVSTYAVALETAERDRAVAEVQL